MEKVECQLNKWRVRGNKDNQQNNGKNYVKLTVLNNKVILPG